MESKEIRGLMEAYASIYTNISEDHFKVGDEVVCKASGMEGEIVKLDKPHGEDDEKYYTVKREDGKTMKYAPNDLKLAKKEKESKKETEKEDVKEAKNGGATKKSETKFHLKLDNLVHGTFGPSPDEKKKMKNEKDDEEKEDEGKEDEGGKHKEGKHKKGKEEKGEKVTEKEGKETEKEMKEGVSYSAKKARAGKDIGKPGRMFGKIAREAGKRYGSKKRGEKVAGAVLAGLREGTDLFDYLLEYLVAEGYADTNKAALAIMANMSEEWKQSIMEGPGGMMMSAASQGKGELVKKPIPNVSKPSGGAPGGMMK